MRFEESIWRRDGGAPAMIIFARSALLLALRPDS